jgi:TPR repeat protein
MFRRSFLIFTGLLLIALIQMTAAFPEDSASEGTITRPDRQEIIGMMIKTAPQQNSAIASVIISLPTSTTPRSDFMNCLGRAYWGNPQAQKCVATAYENGRGIVEDPMDAYVWYSIAEQGSESGDASIAEKLKNKMMATYPAPTEEELEKLVTEQKSQIKQYQEEVKKTGK